MHCMVTLTRQTMTGSSVAGRVFGPPGSGSGSISQRYGPDPAPASDPDPSIIKQK